MGDEDDDRVRIEAAGTDLDEAAAVFEQGYNGTGLVARATEPDFSYRHSATGDSDLTLRTTRFRGELSGTVEPPGEHVVQWLSRGRAVLDVGRDEVQLEVGVPVLFPHGRPFSFRYAEFEQNLVHVDGALLHEVAAEREGAAPGSVRFDHTVAPSPAELRTWNSTVRLIAQTYLGGETSPMMRAEMARLAAVAMLDTFSHTSTSLPEALLAPRNASLRSAVEYVQAHAHLPVTAADVARHAGLTARGLQQSFRRHLDTTPTEYLREVRLERVREELLAGSPDQLTVAEVARRWAFAHLGRFSAAYVTRYGEYPRDTLQRA
jgi:AraC-like DNA-binding protein